MCVAGAVVGVLAAGGASVAAAEELRIAIGGGRVTLIADDAALGDVLAAWARAGGTRFAGAGPIEAARVSLHLVDCDEAQALRWLLQPAAGYVATWRARSDPGASRYERVEIRAASVPPHPLCAVRDQPAGSETVRPGPSPRRHPPCPRRRNASGCGNCCGRTTPARRRPHRRRRPRPAPGTGRPPRRAPAWWWSRYHPNRRRGEAHAVAASGV